ncbi:hypothetical protein CHELA40_50623 [Chelatococcus asaccharovorans]|nr:hypothetical protein CHELA17_20590 [Chelatococcus asaccharovorans]CAH1693626.1 hypothetical protein CHELA40_50623 [Chelatococcus asaccharovorans]
MVDADPTRLDAAALIFGRGIGAPEPGPVVQASPASQGGCACAALHYAAPASPAQSQPG